MRVAENQADTLPHIIRRDKNVAAMEVSCQRAHAEFKKNDQNLCSLFHVQCCVVKFMFSSMFSVVLFLCLLRILTSVI